MFGSSILDIAIGLVFIYLLLSLICTAINEAIAAIAQKRSSNLFEGIKNLLNDPEFTGLAQQLYNHGLIDGISEHASDPSKPSRKPSYIPAAHFSLAMFDILGARGVVAAAHGSLLKAAEEADDAYEVAKDAATANPNDASAQEKLKTALANRDAARNALVAVEQQTQQTLDAAAAAAAKAPNEAPLAAAAAQAKDAADAAAAAVKMVDSRRAAVALAADPKNAAKIAAASDALEKALAAARSVASRCPDPLGNLQRAVDLLPGGHTKESLDVLIDKTRREASALGQHVETFQRNVETWFNDSMARVSGWYKRWTQRVLYVCVTVVVVLSNADTVQLARRLSSDTALRSGLLTAAEAAVKNAGTTGSVTAAVAQRQPGGPIGDAADSVAAQNSTTAGASAGNISRTSGDNAVAATNTIDDSQTPANRSPSVSLAKAVSDSLNQEAAGITLPLGFATWKEDSSAIFNRDVVAILSKILGLVMSIFAVSLGAPFWFDTLSKVVNVRSAGMPPGDTKKGASAGTK